MKRDIACRKNRDVDAALDDQIQPGHRADLRLDRPAQGVTVEKPGHCEQADQHHAEQRRYRRGQALYSLGHRH